MKSNFPAFVRKETLHILRDRRTMLIVLLIPVVLLFSAVFRRTHLDD